LIGAYPGNKVLDELDLFTKRAKQVLLYHLTDLLQSNIAQIAIIGAE
jgi:hypothetical protein